ncbi:hypothetical protein NQZ68_038990 [Dissostichus eleginoides]|nr:hypothetical protein NQZ68_038990 [Dissostichus eleginoides]
MKGKIVYPAKEVGVAPVDRMMESIIDGPELGTIHEDGLEGSVYCMPPRAMTFQERTFFPESMMKTLGDQCVLPDVGIDESLLKYSGTDSNTALQAYSNEMVNLHQQFGFCFGSV